MLSFYSIGLASLSIDKSQRFRWQNEQVQRIFCRCRTIQCVDVVIFFQDTFFALLEDVFIYNGKFDFSKRLKYSLLGINIFTYMKRSLSSKQLKYTFSMEMHIDFLFTIRIVGFTYRKSSHYVTDIDFENRKNLSKSNGLMCGNRRTGREQLSQLILSACDIYAFGPNGTDWLTLWVRVRLSVFVCMANGWIGYTTHHSPLIPMHRISTGIRLLFVRYEYSVNTYINTTSI